MRYCYCVVLAKGNEVYLLGLKRLLRVSFENFSEEPMFEIRSDYNFVDMGTENLYLGSDTL